MWVSNETSCCLIYADCKRYTCHLSAVIALLRLLMLLANTGCSKMAQAVTQANGCQAQKGCCTHICLSPQVLSCIESQVKHIRLILGKGCLQTTDLRWPRLCPGWRPPARPPAPSAPCPQWTRWTSQPLSTPSAMSGLWQHSCQGLHHEERASAL